LVIVSDGCKKTLEIVKPYFYEYLPKIRLIEIPKQKNWSGKVRNAGIFKAEGEIICYLDVDDVLGENHLQIINDNIKNYDWVFFNDLIWDGKEFVENK
jgi:glycosyltransferase involved in cell wall biosynthesis